MPIASSDRLFSPRPAPLRPESTKSGAFTPNMALPVHRWFRYSAGFSAAWAESVIQSAQKKRPLKILDPFAGSGTTLLAAQAQGANAIGLETHPLVARIAKAKLAWGEDPDHFVQRSTMILKQTTPRIWANPPSLLAKIYPRATLATLLGLRDSIEDARESDGVDELLWLALLAILRSCSPVGTAQWQYVLPNKTKAKVAEPTSAFQAQVSLMAEDMREMSIHGTTAEILQEDARAANGIADQSVDLVVTSPPYPNNFDYADATRIEMTFLGEIERWSDLQSAVRSFLIRSCSQHMVRYDASAALDASEVEPIRRELLTVYNRLSAERENHGGRKAYHLMVAAYFHDLAQTWLALRRVCRSGSTAHVVIGDSAPYAVHVPVERWLGELALSAGFRSWSFEKLRDRNTKWKNRKHRVPLHEGILKVEG